jgi:hypothetical protein
MKHSSLKIFGLVAILLVLAGISGGILVYAQQQNGAADEVDRTTGAEVAKVAPQDKQAGSIGVSGASDEAVRESAAQTDKLSKTDSSTAAPAVSGEGMLAPGNDGAGRNVVSSMYKYFTVAGSSFLPATNTINWTYGGVGCIHPTATGYWRAGINIPDGSIIDYMWVGYFVTETSTPTTGFLYSFSDSGVAVPLAQVTTIAGSASYTGFKYVGITMAPLTLNNLNNAYAFAWSGATPASVTELCYFEVEYTPYNAFNVALPNISK